VAYRPFLSHKREDAPSVGGLREELCLRGAGGWQDAHDLSTGQRLTAAFKRAIGRETGGFLWYGTEKSLQSLTIRKIEVPAALRRQRRAGQSGKAYPVVPLFVDISPGEDQAQIKKAFGRRRGKVLTELTGVVRKKGESIAEFNKRAAQAYVRDLIRAHPGDTLRVAISGNREPPGSHDLSLDWRRLLDPSGRVVDPTALPTLIETLCDIRQAAQARTAVPHIVVEPHLRLPLAALVGWEWNAVRPVKLTVVQQSTRGPIEVEESSGPDSWPAARECEFGGSGPAIVAVSVGKDLGEGVRRYANAQQARSALHLHVDLAEYPGAALACEEIASLAQWTVERLTELNANGIEKHLLLLGPVSLAVRVGAAANGTGKTFLPFWDGSAGYTSGIVIG
jgi:SMODS-associated and fused to various effectors sensor domain